MRRNLIIFIWCNLVPAVALADDLAVLSSEINQTGLNLKNLSERFLALDLNEPARSFKVRLTDAEILFLMGDFERASLVLLDLLNNPRAESHKNYGQALYYLAESLFQIGHDRSARAHFQQIITRRDEQRMPEAIRRLIEIADRTKNWIGLDEHLAVFEKYGQVGPAIAYLHAKSLLRQKRPERVREILARIPLHSAYRQKATYLGAVAALQLGDLNTAQKEFAELAKQNRTDKTVKIDTRIGDMAALNQGRILFEQGKIKESLAAYNSISKTSQVFEEALFEQAWVYVRSANLAKDDSSKETDYIKAKKALEILLLSESENALVPEARLLLANISLRLGEYDEAEAMFAEVVARYKPPHDELQELSTQKIPPEELLTATLVDPKQGRGRLPPLALLWSKSQGMLSEALELLSALDESERSYLEAEEIASKLLAVLASPRRLSFFPGLEELQADLLDMVNRVRLLSERLLALERVAAEPSLSQKHKTELENVLAIRLKIEPLYRALPQRKEEYVARTDKMRQTIVATEQQALRLKYDVESMRAQLNGLNIWLSQNVSVLSQAARDEYRDLVANQTGEIAALEKAYRELKQLIGINLAELSLTSAADSQETEIRNQFIATLENESRILANAAAASTKVSDQRSQIVKLRERLAVFSAELESLSTKLENVTSDKAVGMRSLVLKERGLLEQHRQSMVIERQAAKQILAVVANGTLAGVENTFREVVLRGDVGMVDVVWALKERQTSAISHKVNEQRRELEVLDHEFSEILNEE